MQFIINFIIPLLYCCFKWNNEDFNIILILTSGIQKKKITSALEEKLMQKREEKSLKKKLKIETACLARKIGPTRLLVQRPAQA